MKITTWLTGSALLFGLAGAAHAAAGGYGTVSFGPAKIGVDCDGATTCDRSSTGFKLLGGYRGPENVALEGAYWSFGKATLGDGTIKATAKVHAFGALVALHDDFAPDWTAAGRLGIASFKGKIDATAGSATGSSSSSNTSLIGGFSIGYKVLPNLVIEGSIDYARPKFDGERIVTQMFGLGATLSF